MREANDQTRLRKCADSSDLPLLEIAIIVKVLSADPNIQDLWVILLNVSLRNNVICDTHCYLLFELRHKKTGPCNI